MMVSITKLRNQQTFGELVPYLHQLADIVEFAEAHGKYIRFYRGDAKNLCILDNRENRNNIKVISTITVPQGKINEIPRKYGDYGKDLYVLYDFDEGSLIHNFVENSYDSRQFEISPNLVTKEFLVMFSDGALARTHSLFPTVLLFLWGRFKNKLSRPESVEDSAFLSLCVSSCLEFGMDITQDRYLMEFLVTNQHHILAGSKTFLLPEIKDSQIGVLWENFYLTIEDVDEEEPADSKPPDKDAPYISISQIKKYGIPGDAISRTLVLPDSIKYKHKEFVESIYTYGTKIIVRSHRNLDVNKMKRAWGLDSIPNKTFEIVMI